MPNAAAARGAGLSLVLGICGSALARRLDAEQGRWFLWLPVFFGAGIGIYYDLPAEPRAAFAAGIFVMSVAARMLFRTALLPFVLTSLCLCMASGFLVAKIRTLVIAAPQLERRGAYDVEGFVESFDRLTPKRARLILRLRSLKFEDIPVAKMPFRARITLRSEGAFTPGAYLRLRAVLGPPPEPVEPGGYDFARTSFFQGVGASGFGLKAPDIVDGVALPLDMRLRARLAALRARIGNRITEVLPGQTGAIASALTVGQEAGLNQDAMGDLRGAGLAHVISISGLHMSLVAGVVFWFVRFALALLPFIALRFPVRALAGGAALLAVTVYLALSGAAIAAVRSYLMIAVVFLAVLLNRPALSLRNVALSGLLILTVLPDSLIDVSFQMSYAATAALIAGYERFGGMLNFEPRNSRERLLWHPIYFIGGVFVTTLTAGLAVEPFSAYHFHNFTSYAALGNLLGGPPVDFLVMPAMVVALIAMPFGLDRWPLEAMGFGIDLMMRAAKFVAALPEALIAVPAFPFAALLVMILGGLWLIIWRGRWRLAGFAGIGAGIALATIHDRPDILIDRDAKTVAIRDRDGLLAAPRSRRAQYSLGQWLKADGDGRAPKLAASGRGFRCDQESCVALIKGRVLSFIAKPDALPEDCQRAAILVAPMDIRLPCPAPVVILDRGALWEEGASAIYLSEAGIRLVRASDLRGTRPWSPPRHRRELISPLPSVAAQARKAAGNLQPK